MCTCTLLKNKIHKLSFTWILFQKIKNKKSSTQHIFIKTVLTNQWQIQNSQPQVHVSKTTELDSWKEKKTKRQLYEHRNRYKGTFAKLSPSSNTSWTDLNFIPTMDHPTTQESRETWKTWKTKDMTDPFNWLGNKIV